MKKFSFIVRHSGKGSRLDTFLAKQIDNVSRSYISKGIKSGKVSINNRSVLKAGSLLNVGDIIEVNLEKEDSEFRFRDIPATPMTLKDVYEDKDIIVVDKPSGLSVHPGGGNRRHTLINGLLYKYSRMRSVGEPFKFGLVHRIDKDTSGLVIVALNNHAHWYLSRQFEEREVEKIYIVVVGGNISRFFKNKCSLLVSNYIGRHPKMRKRMEVVAKNKGKLATTNFYFEKKILRKDLGTVSLLLAKPITGRTHQIRVQLANLGFPIIGDTLYGGATFSRLLLHACMLKLKMLNGDKREFIAEIPKEFRPFLKDINLTSFLKKARS